MKQRVARMLILDCLLFARQPYFNAAHPPSLWWKWQVRSTVKLDTVSGFHVSDPVSSMSIIRWTAWAAKISPQSSSAIPVTTLPGPNVSIIVQVKPCCSWPCLALTPCTRSKYWSILGGHRAAWLRMYSGSENKSRIGRSTCNYRFTS